MQWVQVQWVQVQWVQVQWGQVQWGQVQRVLVVLSRVSSFARRSGLALCLLLCTVSAAALATDLPAAWAGDQPINPADREMMRQTLVTGEPSARDSVLETLKNTPSDSHAEHYGEVLGKIFRDPEVTRELSPEERRTLYGVMIKHLADVQSADTNKILLAEAFLPHMVADPELVDLLLGDDGLIRHWQDQRRRGWERILDRARELLGDKNDAVRRAAIRISALCDCVDAADAITALHEALMTSSRPMDAAEAEAYLAAAESLLLHRFPSVAALKAFLEPFAQRFAARKELKKEETGTTPAQDYRLRGDLLEGVIRLLKAEGGAETSSAKKTALAYGMQLISKAAGPEDLLVFFDPDEEYFSELQRAALEAVGARLKPQPSEAWATLLTRALSHSSDQAVLQATVAILASTFTKGSGVSQLLASAVASRLEQRANEDDPAQREALAAVLGDIGSRGDVITALGNPRGLAEVAPADIPVYSELIRALGRVSGGFVVTLEPYYLTGESSSPVWQRLAVAKALGYGGIRGDELQAKLAALMLRHILTGDAVTSAENIAAGVPAEPVDAHLIRPEASAEGEPEVRAAAIESLRWYPGAETAAVLARVAGEESPAAKRALTILGRQLEAGSVEAAGALADLITQAVTSGVAEEKIFLEIDTVIGGDAPKAAQVRASLGAAARAVLRASQGSDALRAKAALLSIHLADAKAIEAVREIWAGQEAGSEGRKAWGERLGALFKAAALGGGIDQTPAAQRANDLLLAEQLQEIANAGLRDEVLAFFATMGKAAGRYELKMKHANILAERGTHPDRDAAAQRKDLDEAIGLYRDLAADATPTHKESAYRSLYHTLGLRGESPRLAEGEKSAMFQLEAYRVASKSGSRGLARTALESLRTVLTQAQGLSETDRTKVEQITKDLEALSTESADSKK